MHLRLLLSPPVTLVALMHTDVVQMRKSTEGGHGGGTPHVPTRTSAGFASQSAGGQQQQHAGGPLHTLNGQHGTQQCCPAFL